jgi:hypothetical protein
LLVKEILVFRTTFNFKYQEQRPTIFDEVSLNYQYTTTVQTTYLAHVVSMFHPYLVWLMTQIDQQAANQVVVQIFLSINCYC